MSSWVGVRISEITFCWIYNNVFYRHYNNFQKIGFSRKIKIIFVRVDLGNLFLKNGPTPASFLFFPFSKHNFYRKKLQVSAGFELGRRARWLLDHHHGPGLENLKLAFDKIQIHKRNCPKVKLRWNGLLPSIRPSSDVSYDHKWRSSSTPSSPPSSFGINSNNLDRGNLSPVGLEQAKNHDRAFMVGFACTNQHMLHKIYSF